jgi:hypothetical protein
MMIINHNPYGNDLCRKWEKMGESLEASQLMTIFQCS